MRIVTWNVNSLNVRLPRVLEFLEQHDPDVVCLQETKCEPTAFPRKQLAAAGYVSADHSGGRWSGVAILARDDLSLEDVTAGLPGEPDVSEARWLEATVGAVRMVSVYVPNGRAVGTETFGAKLSFLEASIERLAALKGTPLAVCGDMNVARADIDVYDPEAFRGSTHVTPEERALLERMLSEGGLVDSYRELHPDEVGFTWWDYRQGHFHRKMGLRIDYTLVSEHLAPHLRECGIDRNYRKGTKPSDHAPLITDLAI